MLLNMETPERKPASSTAKRPRVRQSAVTSLRRGQDQAGSGLVSRRPPQTPARPPPPPGSSLDVLLLVFLGGELERQASLDVAFLESRAGKKERKNSQKEGLGRGDRSGRARGGTGPRGGGGPN